MRKTSRTWPLIEELRPGRLITSLTAGLIAGIILVAYSVSFAALAYGDVPEVVARGIGFTMFGATVMVVVIALTSSYPGMVATPQDVPAAILALATAGIGASMAATATDGEIFVTVLATVVICTLVTGLFFLGLGYFNLGDLVRFLPYPVIGGFLAGTGWLLTIGGLGVMTGISLDFSRLALLLQPDLAMRWLPGLVFAVTLLVVQSRLNHYLVMPALILGTIGLFYCFLWATETPVGLVSADGWLIGPFPEEKLWKPLDPADFSDVNWSVVLSQAGNIGTILIVSVVGLLLNATGLELIFRRDVDLNRELRAAGWGNIGAGFGGGLPGYHALTLSALGHKIGGNSRLIGLFAAGVVGGALVLGPSSLSLIPRLVVGGLVSFLGISLLVEWVYQSWFNLSRIDYLIVVTILLVIATVGFLEGVILGIVLAVVLFVVNYSQINVIKHVGSGIEFRSRLTRSPYLQDFLDQHGDQIYILQLQGFIFFGTANALLNQIESRINRTDVPRLRYLVIDFREVTGLDSTARYSFFKMIQLIQARKFHLVLTHSKVEHPLPAQKQSIAEFFLRLRATDSSGGEQSISIFSDLDHGLEWCENQILMTAGLELEDDRTSLSGILQSLMPETVTVKPILKYFEPLKLESGSYLIRQGDPPGAIYFIESGQVTAQIEFSTGQREPVRLETMRGGHMVGEIGFYLNQPRTAAVVTEKPSTIYRLSREALAEMECNDPEAASLFHQLVIRLISRRLGHLINTVNALQR